MPLFYISGSLFEFQHAPRCGGTSVEYYLIDRFGPIGFLDHKYYNVAEALRWNKSSPQHIAHAAMDILLPHHWIRGRFALVRHPEDRILSVFNYARDGVGSLPPKTNFNAWLARLPKRLETNPHCFDNHARPISDIVSSDTQVFKLEDGADNVIAWLDAREGSARGARTLPHANSHKAAADYAKRPVGPVVKVSDSSRALIAEMYAEDFKRFGYEPRPMSHVEQEKP